MKKFSFLIYLIPSFLLFVAALWYFGYYRPAQSPQVPVERVYNTTLQIIPEIAESREAPLSDDTRTTSDDTRTTSDDTRNSEILTVTDKNSDIVSADSPDTNNDITSCEHTDDEHNHSVEEAMSEEAEFAALLEEVYLEREERAAKDKEVQRTMDRATAKAVSHLESLSPEEQRAELLQAKDWVFNELLTSSIGESVQALSALSPNFDVDETLKLVWNDMLTDLTKHGYTLPEGVEKE